MNDKDTYLINTGALYYALNLNRKNNGLMEIDNILTASKIGILFALKTNGYVNFKNERIELDDAQLIALEEIFSQHFNVNMVDEIRTLVITQEPWQESMVRNICSHTPSSSTVTPGFFHKIKGFLKIKSNVQEKPA